MGGFALLFVLKPRAKPQSRSNQANPKGEEKPQINSNAIWNECNYKSAYARLFTNVAFVRSSPSRQFFCFFDDYHQMMVTPPS
jgi:hypothetical protein